MKCEVGQGNLDFTDVHIHIFGVAEHCTFVNVILILFEANYCKNAAPLHRHHWSYAASYEGQSVIAYICLLGKCKYPSKQIHFLGAIVIGHLGRSRDDK